MMLLSRPSGHFTIWTPSKVNVFLEVHAKRADGYHELRTVMVAVSLCDRLCFRPRCDGQIKLGICAAPTRTGNLRDIPTDASNLIVRALQLLRERLGTSQGIDVELWKAIPIQAGLGGGSSNAAAALVGGLFVWSNRYDPSLASELAAQLGSDVNFFLEGHSKRRWGAQCFGRGERVVPLPVARSTWFLIAMPPQGCSTAAVFRRLKIPGKKRDDSMVANALATGNLSELSMGLFNRLEVYAAKESHWIENLRDLFHSIPSKGSFLTGSGSAWVGLFASESEARRAAQVVHSRLPVHTYVARTWTTPSIECQFQALAGIRVGEN